MATTGKRYPTKDAHICGSAQNTNYDETTFLRAGRDYDSTYYRIYIGFSENHGIPEGSIITKATFTDWVYSALYDQEYPFNVSAVGETWKETSVKWSNRPESVSSVARSTAMIGKKDSKFTVDITQIAQAWLDGKGGASFANGLSIYPASGENTTLKNIRARTTTVTDKRPYIEITYTPVSGVKPPTGLAPAAGIYETAPTLSWTASVDPRNNLTGYEIQISLDNGATWGTAIFQTGTSRAFPEFASAPRGASLKFRVRAKDNLNEYTDWVVSNTIKKNALPAMVGGLSPSATARYTNSCAVAWAAATDPDGQPLTYSIERGVHNGVEYVYNAQLATGLTGLSYNDTGVRDLERGALFKYRVRARDSLGAYGAYGYTPYGVYRNQLPPPPTLVAPITETTTYNSRPRFLLIAGTEPDGQLQNLGVRIDDWEYAASGTNFSRNILVSNGGKLVYKSPVPISGRYVFRYISLDTLGEANNGPWHAFKVAETNWTDPVLIPGQTPIRAVHMLELRNAIDNVRKYYGIAAYLWARQILSGITPLKDWTSHVLEMRQAIGEVISFVNAHDANSTVHNIPSPQWVAIPQNSPKAAVIQQIRDIIPTM